MEYIETHFHFLKVAENYHVKSSVAKKYGVITTTECQRHLLATIKN